MLIQITNYKKNNKEKYLKKIIWRNLLWQEVIILVGVLLEG